MDKEIYTSYKWLTSHVKMNQLMMSITSKKNRMMKSISAEKEHDEF
jgi:hypothetical protein